MTLPLDNMLYLAVLTAGMFVAYFFLIYLFTAFFKNRIASPRAASVRSIVSIAIFIIAAYLVSYGMQDPWWGNRIMHAVGGGFLAYFICFLAVKDAGLEIGRFQFFVLSALAVTAMGVGNEILEFFAQYYFNIIASADVYDTWLDLISNTVGICAAAALFTPFVRSCDEGDPSL